MARAAPCLCPIGAWLKPHPAGRRVKSSGKSRRSKPSDHLQAALCTGGGASGQSRETGWAGHPAHPTRRPPPRLCHRLCRVRCARARACASSLQQRAASSWRQAVDVQAVGSSAQVFGAGIEGRSAGGRSAGARRALGGHRCGCSPRAARRPSTAAAIHQRRSRSMRARGAQIIGDPEMPLRGWLTHIFDSLPGPPGLRCAMALRGPYQG